MSNKANGPPQDGNGHFARNPYLRIIHCGDDEVVVKHGSRSRFTRVIRDDGRSKLLGRILRNVSAPTNLTELRDSKVISEAELDQSAQLVNYLQQEGVLVEPSKDLVRVYLDTILGGGAALSSLRSHRTTDSRNFHSLTSSLGV
jgi:hypothetical protein